MWKDKNYYRQQQRLKLIIGFILLTFTVCIGAQEIYFIAEFLHNNLELADMVYRCLAMVSVWFAGTLIIALIVDRIR